MKTFPIKISNELMEKIELAFENSRCKSKHEYLLTIIEYTVECSLKEDGIEFEERK